MNDWLLQDANENSGNNVVTSTITTGRLPQIDNYSYNDSCHLHSVRRAQQKLLLCFQLEVWCVLVNFFISFFASLKQE